MNLEEAKRAIITVGGGRGFVAQGGDSDRFVVSAAHCLPSFPPCASFSDTHERTYKKLLGPLQGCPTIWTECCFVDPIADITVLGPPDDQELYDEWRAYEAFMEGTVPIAITGSSMPQSRDFPAWLFSLDGEWFRCNLWTNGGPLTIKDASRDIIDGMSGSPIISDDGLAIGLVCCSSGNCSENPELGHREGFPNPKLVDNLPGWFLRYVIQTAVDRAVEKVG